MSSSSLTLRDALLALAVVFVWGTNFVVIRIGLDVLPPLLFAALRFTFVLLPAVFFLPRPGSVGASRSDHQKVPWANLAVYGASIGLGQFGLLFIAMNGMISPGLASLVVQCQVFFTIGFAMLRSGEKPALHQLAAVALAVAGMGVIVAHNGPGNGQGATAAGVALTLAAAASWAVSNQAAKEVGRVNVLAYVVWSSLFSAPPLYLLSFALEGWGRMAAGVTHAAPTIWAVILWQSVGNTIFGYGCWAWLIGRYPAVTVAPMALLVPVFGFAASALWLGEPLQGWKIAAALLVMGGLAINLLWKKRASVFPAPSGFR